MSPINIPKPEFATRFWWIRHAVVPQGKHQMYGSLDVDCDTSDTPLFQAVASKLPTDAIWYTSTLKRTQQTADALLANGASCRSVSRHADLVEQDFGDYNGMDLKTLLAQRDDPFVGFWPWPPEQQAKGGESFTMMRDRVARFIKQALQHHPGEDVVCVAHRGPILAALQIALNMPTTQSVGFSIGNVSISRLTHHGDVDESGPQWRVSELSWLP